MLLKMPHIKHSFALILLIGIFMLYSCIAATDGQSQPEPQAIANLQDPTASITERLFSPAAIACLAVTLWLTAPEEVQERLLNQLAPGKLAKNFLTQYCSWALTTLCHEGGHALVQSLATGRPSTIHFGAGSPTKKPPLLTLGNLHIDGLNPCRGNTPPIFMPQEQKDELIAMVREAYKNAPNPVVIKPQAPQTNDLKQCLLPDRRLLAIFLLAGGLSGILAHCAAEGLILKQPLRIDGITINQLCNALVPMDENSDGAALWRDCVGVSPALINVISEIAPVFEIAAEMYAAYNDPDSDQNSPIHSKLLVGFINFFSRGYLRFHV